MGENYIQKMISDRISKGVLSPHGRLEASTDSGVPVIDLSTGAPDAMADIFVIEALAREASKWENRGCYEDDEAAFKAACAAYLQETFAIRKINPKSEVTHTSGSKSAFSILPQLFINPSDITIMTVPGCSDIGGMTHRLGGDVYTVPLKPDRDFLPDLSAIPGKIAKRAKLLYINYPNNPTGACATMGFYEQVVQFAKDYGIVVVQDAGYSAFTYDEERPLSFLSCKGAKKVGVELHSLGMAFNMEGWRIGFIAGNETIIKAFASYRDSVGLGQFKAIRMAGKYALEHTEITEHTAIKYGRRLDLLTKTLNRLGFKAAKPHAGVYIYTKAPKGIKGGVRFKTSEEFTRFLLSRYGIAAKPYEDCGNYIRFSVTYAAFGEDEEKRVMNEIVDRLKGVKLEW